MSAASVILAPVVICDSSSEDEAEKEDTDVVPYNWQKTRPVQYQVLDVFGDNDVKSSEKKTSESIIIEDDEDEAPVVTDEKTVTETENWATIDLTEDNDVTSNGDHTPSDDVTRNIVKHKTSPALTHYVKQVNHALQKNGVAGSVGVKNSMSKETQSRLEDSQNGHFTTQDVTRGIDNGHYMPYSTVSQSNTDRQSQGQPAGLNDDLIVTGESKTVHATQQKDVVYGTMTGGVVEHCQGGEPVLVNEQVEVGCPWQQYSYSTELSLYNDGGGPLIDQVPQPMSETPQPISEPIMNLVCKDNVRWYMTPEDREIVPRWSSIQNGDMVVPLCAPHNDDNNTMDDTPVQYTTIDDILPPPANNTTKQQKSAKTHSQTKQEKSSKGIIILIPNPVKNNNKTKQKQCLKKAEKAKQKPKHKTSKVADTSVHKAASKGRGGKGLNTKTHSHRIKNGLNAWSLPRCSVHVCYGMIYHGTRVECPCIVTPHSRPQSQDRSKQTGTKHSNQKLEVSPKCANHRDIDPARGGRREVFGRRKFSRAVKTRQAVM